MRLSLPSYLVPGTWLENLEVAAGMGWVEGIELLFFAWDEDARSILARELPGIAALAERFSFSLHLPDPLGPGDEELVRITRQFTGSYVLHPPRPEAPGKPEAREAGEAWAALVEAWRGSYGDAFHLEYTGAAAFARAESLLPGLPLCADTGRLLLDGEDPAAWIAERAGRVREIHLHRAVGGKDHASLARGEAWLERLRPLLRDFAGAVELEVFSLDSAIESHNVLVASLAEAGA